jgi:glycosyltransferase involved in cell wall biosynthesis
VVIWIVNPFDLLPGEPGRPGRYRTLSEVLASRGHEVVWWTSDFSHRFKTQRIVDDLGQGAFAVRLLHTRPYRRNISLARVYNHRQFGGEFYRAALEELRRNAKSRPDRIVVSMPPLSPASMAIRLRDEWGGKVIVDIQDAWPETFRRLVPGVGRAHELLAGLLLAPFHRQAQSAYKRADAITAVAETYVDLSGARHRDQPSCVAYLGAPFRELDASTGMNKRAMQPFTFIYLGSLSANYDLETLIRAAAIMQQNGCNFRVLIAGMGPHEDSLRGLSRELALESVLEFRGYLTYDKVVSLLGKSDCGLNPILPECWCAMPNKVADYFGAGLPVINSIPGELSELIRKNDAGAYYQAGNVESLARVMSEYVIRPEIAERQAPNARRVGEDLFKRETTYVGLAQFIEGL